MEIFISETPWTAAHQAPLSSTVSLSFCILTSIELVMPSNHITLCHSLLLLPSIFPSISGSFPVSWLFASGGQSTGASASASVLPLKIQGWFLLGLTGLISLLSMGLSKRLLPHHSSNSEGWQFELETAGHYFCWSSLKSLVRMHSCGALTFELDGLRLSHSCSWKGHCLLAWKPYFSPMSLTSSRKHFCKWPLQDCVPRGQK